MDSGFKFVLYDFSVDKSDAISSGLLQSSSLFVWYLLHFVLNYMVRVYLHITLNLQTFLNQPKQ